MADNSTSDLPCLAEELTERPSASSRLNFSRPRPLSQGKVYHDRHDSATQIPAASDGRTRSLHNDLPPLWPPPLFSRNSDYTTSAASEFSWDPESGELRSRNSDVDYSGRPSMVSEKAVPFELANDEAAPKPRHVLQKRTRSVRTASSGSSENSRGPLPQRPKVSVPSRSSSKIPASIPHFVAELPGDNAVAGTHPQQSVPSSAQAMTSNRGIRRAPPSTSAQSPVQQRPSSRASTAESERSHHTVSDAEGEGEAQHWRGSDFDTSGLSVKKVQKLRKKGVNPALYAEMKAARKGKNRWVGSLTGNSFLG